jgi:hypothetical protein
MSGPEKGKKYNLIPVLPQALENTWHVDQYISDAEGDGDNDLAASPPEPAEVISHERELQFDGRHPVSDAGPRRCNYRP